MLRKKSHVLYGVYVGVSCLRYHFKLILTHSLRMMPSGIPWNFLEWCLKASVEPKDMHLDQGQGQITLKTFGHSLANTFISARTLDWTDAIIVKLRFHFDSIGIIIQQN